MEEFTALREPTDAERTSFRKAARALAKLGKAGLYIYLEDDTLNLMTGPSHSGGGSPHQERVRESVHVPRGGGGGW